MLASCTVQLFALRLHFEKNYHTTSRSSQVHTVSSRSSKLLYIFTTQKPHRNINYDPTTLFCPWIFGAFWPLLLFISNAFLPVYRYGEINKLDTYCVIRIGVKTNNLRGAKK